MAGLGLDLLSSEPTARHTLRLCRGSGSQFCVFSLNLHEIKSIIWISVLAIVP